MSDRQLGETLRGRPVGGADWSDDGSVWFGLGGPQRIGDDVVWFGFGPHATGVAAIFAFQTLHDTRADIPHVGPLWHESENHSLAYTLILEDQLQQHGMVARTRPAVSEVGTARGFGAAVLRWHAALPFSVAERARLLDVNRSLGEKSIAKLDTVIDTLPEATAISEGVLTTADGPELKRRWRAWHEQLGEFAGQGSLIQARRALRDIVALCELPEGDRDLESFSLHVAHPAWRTEPT